MATNLECEICGEYVAKDDLIGRALMKAHMEDHKKEGWEF